MCSSETSDDKKKITAAVCNGQLEDIFELSTKFSANVKFLSETLIKSCLEGSSGYGEMDERTYCS